MRVVFGIALLLLAGCDVPPERVEPRSQKPTTPGASGVTDANARSPQDFYARDGWGTLVPDTERRIARFILPGVPDGPGDAGLSVWYFEEGAGDVASNFARWTAQFEPEERQTSESQPTSGRLPRAELDVRGTHLFEERPGEGVSRQLPDHRLLAAIVETAHQPYYIKLIGPAATVATWESSFQSFLDEIEH